MLKVSAIYLKFKFIKENSVFYLTVLALRSSVLSALQGGMDLILLPIGLSPKSFSH